MAKVVLEKDGESTGGLLLSNPNAYEGGDTPASPIRAPVATTASKERPPFTRTKNRSKRPFLKMIVGGLRKLSIQDSDDVDGEGTTTTGSFSDPEEPMTPQSPADKYTSSERQQIDYLATLPRKKPAEWRKNSMDKVILIQQTSREDSRGANAACESSPENLESHSPEREPVNRAISDSPTFTDTHTEYRLAGLDALEMLHNQLQILVRQECDDVDMADTMHEKVLESCRAQIRELQDTVQNLQNSDQDLQLSLRLAEVRAQESEIKLQNYKEHYHKMEHNYKGLEKEYKRLYKKHKELEKYLQKKAVLNQISTEQSFREKSNSQTFEKMSPTKVRRPGISTVQQQLRKHRSSESSVSPSHTSHTVKRYNSSEHIPRNHHLQSANTTGTLPRHHSGSMSHTETRV